MKLSQFALFVEFLEHFSVAMNTKKDTMATRTPWPLKIDINIRLQEGIFVEVDRHFFHRICKRAALFLDILCVEGCCGSPDSVLPDWLPEYPEKNYVMAYDNII